MRGDTLFGNIVTDTEGKEALNSQEIGLFGKMIEKTYFWDEDSNKPRSREEATIQGTKLVNGRRWIWYTLDWNDDKTHQYLWAIDEYFEDKPSFELNGVVYKAGDHVVYGKHSVRGKISDIQYRPVLDKVMARIKMLPISHDDIGMEYEVDKIEGLRHLTAGEAAKHYHIS